VPLGSSNRAQGLVVGAAVGVACCLLVSRWRRRREAAAAYDAVRPHVPEPVDIPEERPGAVRRAPVADSERLVIERAVQVVRHRNSTTAEAAGEMLERVSSDTGVPLHRLAVQVTAGVPLEQLGGPAVPGPSVLGE